MNVVAKSVAAVVVAFVPAMSLAADLPVRSAAPEPVFTAVHNWTGFYAGVHAGAVWLNGKNTQIGAPLPLLFPNGTVIGGNTTGFLGGVQIGYNYQTNNLVLGVEADGSLASTRISVTTPSPLIPGATATGTTRSDWYATLTGRIGFAANNWLFYAKGGAAFSEFKFGGNANIPPFFLVNPVSSSRVGWTLGLGAEYAISRNWSAKIEYNYMDFGSKQHAFTTTPAVGTTFNNVRLNAHVVKFGLNYLFSSSPAAVIAKY